MYTKALSCKERLKYCQKSVSRIKMLLSNHLLPFKAHCWKLLLSGIRTNKRMAISGKISYWIKCIWMFGKKYRCPYKLFIPISFQCKKNTKWSKNSCGLCFWIGFRMFLDPLSEWLYTRIVSLWKQATLEFYFRFSL